jgi:uncharacterized protein YbjT (DUF2867 family)
MGRHYRLGFPLQQAVAFQLFQVLDQHFFGDGRNGFPDLAIAFSVSQEVIQNDGFPIAAYLLHNKRNRALLKGELLILLYGGGWLDLCHDTYFRVSTCLIVSTNIPLFPTNTKVNIMKITVTGSLGNISRPLAQNLVKAGHQVTVISSKKEKTAEIQAMGANAAIGSVEDLAFLTSAFSGADAVYTMVPPNFAANNLRGYISDVGNNYAKAIRASGVKKIVNLSSIGAHLPEGTGPIKGLYDVEHTLDALDGVAVKHLRAGFFYNNFYANVKMIKHMGILGSNYAGSNHLPLVNPADIADAAAEELQQHFTGKGIRYVVSDERTAGEAASILGAAIGKPDLKWVEFSDADALGGMKQAGLPEEMAKNYTEMGTAVRENKLWDDYIKHKPAVLGKRKFAEFAKEFAAVYNS